MFYSSGNTFRLYKIARAVKLPVALAVLENSVASLKSREAQPRQQAIRGWAQLSISWFSSEPALPVVAVLYFRGSIGSGGITFSSAKPAIDAAFDLVSGFSLEHHNNPQIIRIIHKMKTSNENYYTTYCIYFLFYTPNML
jgi:hypothetical protein